MRGLRQNDQIRHPVCVEPHVTDIETQALSKMLYDMPLKYLITLIFIYLLRLLYTRCPRKHWNMILKNNR